MRIGGFEIVPGGQPYIVAEVGSNFQGFDDCILSIKKAAECGANAVKFQMFDHKQLYGFPKTKASAYQEQYELQIDWIPRLKQQCDLSTVDFMVSVFDPQLVRVVDRHVYAHKIASSDLNYEELLFEINRMGKPVFVSCGAATQAEIKMAATSLSSVPVCFLYCVAAYPAKAVDLTLIDQMRVFGQYIGFSDHTTDAIYIPYAANKFHGAVVIEKHFTAINAMTPDSGHSLSPADFKLMVDRIRGKRQAFIGPTPEEQDMILRHKRRLVATEVIKKGDLYRQNKNFGSFRSMHIDTKGMSPWNASYVNGKTASRDMEIGEGIGSGDFL